MSLSFKAAVLVESNNPLEIGEIKPKDKLGPGQVLVKINTSGICGSQLGEISAVKGKDKYLPHLLGHEGSATVMEIGPGVSSVEISDKVVLHWRPGSGIQAEPAKYLWDKKTINSGWVTTFSEYSIISENRCTKIPTNTPDELAAMMGCAITTGFGVINNDAKVKIGESIVVYGAGGVGLNIIQAARLSGAYPIIAVDLYDNRLEVSKKLGATHVINASKIDPLREITSILESQGLDIFIDNTGIPKIIESGYSLLSNFGRMVLVGVPRENSLVSIYTLPLHFGKKLIGSHGGGAKPEKDIPRLLRAYDRKLFDFNSLELKAYDLCQVNEALDYMRSGESSGRVFLKC